MVRFWAATPGTKRVNKREQRLPASFLRYKGSSNSSLCTSTMGRSPCCEKPHTKRGAWTKEEDQLLISYIRAYGEGCWRSLPKAAGLQRCGKSCRLRWINYLQPDLKRGNFTEEEDELIIKLHSIIGNKWSVIAGHLSGRTDNEIKNYWNTRIKRKLIAQGLNPKTHLPLDSGSDHSALSCDRWRTMPLAVGHSLTIDHE